jgi:hypothetical protein
MCQQKYLLPTEKHGIKSIRSLSNDVQIQEFIYRLIC